MSQIREPSDDLKQVLSALYGSVQPELFQVEDVLSSELSSSYPEVEEIVRHGTRLGGKRLRPALLLLAGQATGSLSEAHITLAAVVEMIHLATLVHDDVLDEATIRRHVDTVNARWNNETSVLLGDFLFTHAFYLASTTESTYACRTIGKSTNIVCEGELRQTTTSGDLELSEEKYLEIVEAKTAQLCACCCQLGAYYAGANPETVKRISNFGRNLGIAFQIADDLLDLEGSEEMTGKSLGTDLIKCKLTLPLIHARNNIAPSKRQYFLDLMRSKSSKRAEILNVISELDSVAYAYGQAQLYVDRATTCLFELEESRAKDTLQAMADFVVSRNA